MHSCSGFWPDGHEQHLNDKLDTLSLRRRTIFPILIKGYTIEIKAILHNSIIVIQLLIAAIYAILPICLRGVISKTEARSL